jgi:hypothetical protein
MTRRRLRHLAFLPLLAALTLGTISGGSATAAAPPAGTIGPAPGTTASWQGQFYPTGTVQPVPETCPPPAPTCDHFSLTVNVPASHWNTNTGGADISITWASADDDFDLYVYDNTGAEVGRSAAGGTTSEQVFIQSASLAGSPYEVRVVPFLILSVPGADYDGTATFVSQAGGPAPNPVRSTGGLAFSPPATVVDGQRTEGEPLNWINPLNGDYWETGPWGFSTGQSFIHRSVDGGDQFNIVSFQRLRPNLSPAGGGDSDIVTDDQGFAYFADLEGLVEIGCAVTNDNGNNWKTNPACVATTLDDRQWLAMDNGSNTSSGALGTADNTVFHAYRQVPLGSFIYSSPGSTGTADPIGGVVYQNSSASPGAVSTGAPCGQLRFDPVNRNLYYPCAEGDHVNITIGHVGVGQRTGIFYTNVDAPASPGGAVGDIFPAVATDSAGNVYAVWVDEIDHNVYYAYSTDKGQTWTGPRQINGNEANSNVFPWAQGGSPGTLAVAWLGNSSHLDSDNMPSWYNDRQAATAFKWFGYASLIRNATSGSPSYAQAKFTDQPMHYGEICNEGLGCTLSGGDRTMADFMALFIQPNDGNPDLDDGAMRLVYNDTTSQHHGAHIFEVRQVAGPSALGGTISQAVQKNPAVDATGDAQDPHYAPTGAGANKNHLDFTKLKLSQPSAGILRVEMTLAAPPAPGLVPAGELSNVWLTRFQALSVGDGGEESYRIFYVGAESAGGFAPPTFFAGSGDSAQDAVPGDGCTTTTPENCKIVQYPSEVIVTTGSVSGSVITIDVPLQGGFGANRPIFGNTLYNVTALSAGRGNLGMQIGDIYADVDATKSFDFAVTGQPPPPPPPEDACKITGGGAITTLSGEGSFSLNAHESLKGKVQYRDRPAADFRSTRLTDVSCNQGAKTATIEGQGINNGHEVEFTVEVIDNGEPGRTDVFQIELSDGYSAGGTLTRGNIQVHN